MNDLGNLTLDVANKLESKLAGLSKFKTSVDGVPAVYLQNKWHKPSDNKCPIVLLHGFSADKYIWNRFAKHLTKDYDVIIPDLLGHGELTYSKTQKYSVPEQVSYLLALLDKLGVKNFHAIGNSMGGMMVAQLINVAKQRVQGRVLIDPAGAISDFSTQASNDGHNPFLIKDLSGFFEFYKLTMHKAPFVPNFVLRSVGRTYISKCQQFEHMFRDFFNLNDFFSDKSNLSDKKSLLIWGTEDHLLPYDDHKIWECILDTKVLSYENVGHMPMVEISEHCACDIKNYLNSI